MDQRRPPASVGGVPHAYPMSMRETVRAAAREAAWVQDDPRHAFPHCYREEKDEAFTALIQQVLRDHPNAYLRRVGEDMGGPIWAVETNDG